MDAMNSEIDDLNTAAGGVQPPRTPRSREPREAANPAKPRCGITGRPVS